MREVVRRVRIAAQRGARAMRPAAGTPGMKKPGR